MTLEDKTEDDENYEDRVWRADDVLAGMARRSLQIQAEAKRKYEEKRHLEQDDEAPL